MADLLRKRLTALLLMMAVCGTAQSAMEVGPKRSPEEGDPCDPTAERLHSVSGEKAAFLICDLEHRVFHLHHCDSTDGILRIFAADRQQCVAAHEEFRWLLMMPPNTASWKKVGDPCVVNRECWDGMYCNGGICACYLNYAQVNSMCVRIASTCPGSTYYPAPVDGKPKVCSQLDPCPPGYICRPEMGGDQGFCCLATASEVCGSSTALIVNSRPVTCYDQNALSEACPEGYTCRLYALANRRYCCKEGDKEISGSKGPEAGSKGPETGGVWHPHEIGRPPPSSKPDPVYCPAPTFAFIHEGSPVVCNPNTLSSCPRGSICQRNLRLGLHFCCSDDGTASSTPASFTTSVSLVGPDRERTWIRQPVGVDGKGNLQGPGSYTLPPEICSPSNRPFTYEGKPVLCIANDSASCPVGYVCTMHTPTVYFCCRMSPGAEPNLRPISPGSEANFRPFSGSELNFRPVTYTPSTEATLSSTFKPPPVPAPSIESICGPSSKPYLYGGNPVMCMVNETGNCPFGYVCDLHFPSDAYFCCQRESATTTKEHTTVTPSTNQLSPRSFLTSDGCPEKTQPAKDQNGGVQICDPFMSLESCPSEFVCVHSTVYGRYQCCTKELTLAETNSLPEKTETAKTSRKIAFSPSTECPPGQVPYHDPLLNQTITCAANHLDSCPGGYFCQWSEVSGKFVCCGVNAGCPMRGVAHVSATTGQVHHCKHHSDTSCPSGYTCQRAHNGSFVCCSGGVGSSGQPRQHPVSTETGQKLLTLELPNISPTILPPVMPGKICPVGLPMPEIGGTSKYKVCSERAPCPAGYECLPSGAGTVCCLKPEKICILPEDVGTSSCANASNTLPRFFYEPSSESCKPFTYNGCGGNLNNFLSLAECEQFCFTGICPRGLPVRVNGKAQQCTPLKAQECPTGYACTASAYGTMSKTVCCPKEELICNLTPLPGQPCHSTTNFPPASRYHYNAYARTCKSFSYFGCNGNANNFETLNECRAFCSNVPIEQPTALGTPSGLASRTMPETAAVITPSPPSPYSQSVSHSPAPSSSPLHQPPVPSESVQPPPSPSGAAAHLVTTTAIPTQALDVFRCPVFGQMLHSDPAFRTCLPASVYPCPDGFTCQKAVKNGGDVTDKFVCCGPPTGPLRSQICPNGTNVYINPLAKQPAICNPADAEACPKDFGCVLSKFMRTFYCCSTSVTHRGLLIEPPPPFSSQLLNMEEIDPDCPSGRKPFMYPRTNKPLACIKPTSVCPPTYSCTLSTNPTMYLCCSDKKDPDDTRTTRGTPLSRYLPTNPYLQSQSGLPPPGTSRTSRSNILSAKAPPSVGQWVPPADGAYWPQGSDTLESEPLLPYGQVRVQNTDTMLPVALPLDLFVPSAAADGTANDPVRSITCNITQRKQLGEDCCAHEQCLHYCGNFQGRRMCTCPRHRLLDFTHTPPRCSSTCTKWRTKGLCLPDRLEAFPGFPFEEQPKSIFQRRAQTGTASR